MNQTWTETTSCRWVSEDFIVDSSVAKSIYCNFELTSLFPNADVHKTSSPPLQNLKTKWRRSAHFYYRGISIEIAYLNHKINEDEPLPFKPNTTTLPINTGHPGRPRGPLYPRRMRNDLQICLSKNAPAGRLNDGEANDTNSIFCRNAEAPRVL